jgi:ssDNA-specific exonuclease RecJ
LDLDISKLAPTRIIEDQPADINLFSVTLGRLCPETIYLNFLDNYCGKLL